MQDTHVPEMNFYRI